MPLANRLQAIETILDSNQQKKEIDRKELRYALRLVRSVQYSLFGKHYVKELSLTRFIANPTGKDRACKQNWYKWKKEHPKESPLC